MAGRKLLWIALGYSAALLTGVYLLPEGSLPWAALVPALGFAAALAAGGSRRVQAALSLGAAALGLLWLWGYTALTIAPAEALAGEKRSVTVRISDYPAITGDYARVTGRCMDPALPRGKILLYSYDGGFAELCPGDIVEMPLKLLSARRFYGEESDYYLTTGIHLRGYTTGEYTVLGRWSLSWLYAPQTLARLIQAEALDCFPPDTAPLMKALLTGDRTEYYQDDSVYSAMRTAGFSHIIAVSGMHVAFLMELLRLLMGRRRTLALAGIPLILGFMAFVGFTPSVVRAGAMQMLLLLAPLLGREDDPPTSLAAALLLLLGINPLAVGSVSLQFSFASMAGLLLLTPRVHDALALDAAGRWRLPGRGTLWGGALRWLWSAFSASLGAMVFTAPLSSVYSGFVPLYGLLTNLLCLWAMSAAFLLGYGVCLLGAVWLPLGRAAGWVVGWLPRYVLHVVKRIAHLPDAALFTRWNLGGWWLIFVLVLLGGSWLLREKGRWRPVLPVCISLCTLCVVSLSVRSGTPGGLEVTAVDVGQGSCFIAMTDSATVMVDCGGSGMDNAGDRAADYLLQKGRDRVDLLILTHFHADHVNGVARLMSRLTVSRLAFAADTAENEYTQRIRAAGAAGNTEEWPIAENTEFTVGELEMTVFAPLGVGDPNEECLLIRGDFGDFEFLVTGDAGGDVERLLSVLYELGDMELLVVGHHGSRYSTSEALLDAITPEAAFISVGADNDYGHPAPEVLERLEKRGIRVWRTDLDGNASLAVKGESNGKS